MQKAQNKRAAVKKSTGSVLKESDIQRAICDYLAIKQKRGDLLFWRQNNNPIYSEGRMRALPKYARHGIPDIFVVSCGTFIGLEVKRKGAYQSKHQKEFEADLKDHGAEYYVVRDVQDVIGIGL